MPVDPEDRSGWRLHAMADLLGFRNHAPDCSIDGTHLPRVEAFGAIAPADPARRIPEREITVVRCTNCRGQVTVEEPYATYVRRIEVSLRVPPLPTDGSPDPLTVEEARRLFSPRTRTFGHDGRET